MSRILWCSVLLYNNTQIIGIIYYLFIILIYEGWVKIKQTTLFKLSSCKKEN